jgi:hypothetical protein
METLNIEIVNPKAKMLLLDLAEMNLININPGSVLSEALHVAHPVKKKVTFDSISLDTSGFKFDRDEANRR